jgi:ribosomal RNA-processing protein 12
MDDVDDNFDAVPFPEVVQELCTPGRDENSAKTAAVASALVEVIKEKMGADSFEKISPAALFASTLNALTSTVTSDTIDVAASPQLSLLEILRQVVPYVSSANPNLYLHQFSTTSRALRGVVASIPKINRSQDQSKISNGWNALLRQCMRTSSAALNGILVLDNAQSMEKEVLKCFHGTILQQFDDSRAKVRRQAHGCTLELMLLSKSLGNSGLYRLIPDHMVEYTHHILESFAGSSKKRKKQNDFEKKEMSARLLHLLSFLNSSLLATEVKTRLKIGADLMKLFTFAINADDTANGDNQGSVMVANGALMCLLQIFDNSDREGENESSGMEEEDAFCAQQWATLLQANMKIIAFTNNGNEGDGECRLLYARSVVAITIRLLSDGISEDQKPVMQALVPKLLPLSFTTIINCVGDESLPKVAVQSICAELGRLVRSSGLKRMIENDGNLGASTKCIDSCVAATQKMLHYRYRSNWDGCLPCIASLVIAIVHGMIPSSGSDEATLAKMQRRVKQLVGGIIQLHADADDKASKKIAENAIEFIVQGVGVEIIMGLVDLSKGSKDSNVNHGAVSNERAWILNAIKASVSTGSSPYQPRLAFFQSHVLALARKCDLAGGSDNLTAVEASIQRSRVIDLWSLFPSFCSKPIDVEVTFPALAQTIVRAMGDKRYPELLVSLSVQCCIHFLFYILIKRSYILFLRY